ncbi:MAG: hypothetical protein WDM90_03465 [Ferruginibacter sp.]
MLNKASSSKKYADEIKKIDSLLGIEKYTAAEKITAAVLKQIKPNEYADLALFNYYLGFSLMYTQNDSAIYYLNIALINNKKNWQHKWNCNKCNTITFIL